MDQDTNLNLESLAGETIGNDVGSADGGQSVGTEDFQNVDVSQPEALSLNELNNYLGKNFPNKETALKALKDTFAYVGKKKDDVIRDVSQANSNENPLAKELKDIKNEMFYDKNPEYKDYRKVIEKMGANPSDVVNSAEFKQIFTEAKGFRDSQKLKSVLGSNPRVQASQDKLSQAKQAMQTGSYEQATALAAQAVLEAYGN